MSRIIKFAKLVRRNWKKSTVIFGILAYGSSYGIDRYQTFQMMRAYCEEAKVYGDKVLPNLAKPKHVTVILNPEANNKKSNVQFEKFAAPLLHLAGYKVSIFQTEQHKQALELMKVMSNTDAVLVAGGNGTLHEVITGLMRRSENEDETIPLGIIPLGKTNTLAHHLFGSKSTSNVQLIAEAVMAVVREETASLDVMKVQSSSEQNPVYAVCSFEQGTFAEVEPKIQKYWYFGFLKDKFTYCINYFKTRIPVNHSSVSYLSPCDGCSQCFVSPKAKSKLIESGRWWSAFVPRQTDSKNSQMLPDYSKVVNENCAKYTELEPVYSNFSVFTKYADKKHRAGGPLCIKLYPKDLSFTQFVLSGLSHKKSKLEDKTGIAKFVNARKIIIKDFEDVEESNSEDSEHVCYIDNEKYKMSSYEIEIIPKCVTVYG